jgi:hypothetical protein
MQDEPFKVADSRGLTDVDWAELNKLKNAYGQGSRAYAKACRRLLADPCRAERIFRAIEPAGMREALKDELAERGLALANGELLSQQRTGAEEKCDRKKAHDKTHLSRSRNETPNIPRCSSRVLGRSHFISSGLSSAFRSLPTITTYRAHQKIAL